MAGQDVLLLPRLARVRQDRRHGDLVRRGERHERDEVRHDVDVGVQRVDRRVGAMREERAKAAQAGLDEPAIIAQKAVEEDGDEAAIDEGSTMLKQNNNI